MSQPKNLEARVIISDIKKRLERLPEIDWFTGPESCIKSVFQKPYILRLYKFKDGELLHGNQKVCSDIENTDIATFIAWAPRDIKLLIETCEDLIDQIGVF